MELQDTDKAMREALEEIIDSPSEENQDVIETDEVESTDENRETSDEESSDDVEEEESPEEAKPEEDETNENGTQKEPDEDIDLPQNMPKDLRDVLEKINSKEALQSHVDIFKKMEASMQRKSQVLSADRKFAGEIRDVFDEFGQGNIKDKVAVVKNYLNLEKQLEKNPENTLKLIMKAIRVDPNEFAEKILDSQDYSMSEGDKKLQQKIELLEDRLSQYETKIKRDDVRQINESIDRFKNQKDDKGNLKHPFFDELVPEMHSLAKANPDLPLDKLYEGAIVLNDGVAAKVENLKKIKQSAVNKSKIAKIKKISKQNVRSRPSNTKPKDFDAQLRQALDSIL